MASQNGEHLTGEVRVDWDRTVTGSVVAETFVTSRAQLVVDADSFVHVNGHLDGDDVLGDGATCLVIGNFSGRIEARDAAHIFVAGNTTNALPQNCGVLVAAGTLVGGRQLHADGSLEWPRDGEKINVSGSPSKALLYQAGRFIPIDR